MRKLLFVICAMLSLSVAAQNVSKTYYFENPEIVEHNGYIMVEFENTMQSAVLGNPMLPYAATQLLLSPGCEASDVIFEYGKLVPIASKGTLYPKQPVRPISHPEVKEFFKNDDVYASKSAYPSQSYGQITTGFYRGHSIANVAFTPVVYIPADNSLAYYESVKVTVVAEKTNRADNALSLLKNTDDIYKRVDNTDAISEYKSLTNNRKTAEDYDMIIISSDQFENDFDTLITMYARYGIFAQFKSLSAIYDEMEGRDNQEKIRNYIIQEYTDHSIEYVLLGGDADVFPYRGFYCTVQSSSPYVDYGIPADVYFSALDGTWNDNNDDKWGEIGEDDLYPEVSVSRMPFSNFAELENILHKVTSYQLNPVLGELDKVGLVGEWMYSNPDSNGSDYLNLLIGEHDDNGYTTIGIPENHHIDSLYEENNGFNTNLVKTFVNQGYNYIYHAGHANETYVMALNNPDITNQNFSMLDGVTHNYSLFYSHGCICGSFDYNDCITEKMLTLENFAVGVNSNSRYGWFNEGQTEGPSAHLNREYVDALYNDKFNRFGTAQKESKFATAPWVNAPGQWEEGALRWCFYDCNSLGDPALQVWIDEPYELSIGHDSFLNPEAESFEVVAYNLSLDEFEAGARIVLKFGETVIGRGVTDEDGVCNIEVSGDLPLYSTVKILVSGYNTFVKEYSVKVGGNALNGDANMDGGVSILDIVSAVAYIAEENPQPFDFNLADVNNDGQINVIDVIGIVNIIFGSYNLDNCNENAASYYIEDGILYLDTPVELAGLQFIFNDSVSPFESNLDGLEIVTKQLINNKFLLLAYSTEGQTIAAGKHAILEVGGATPRKVVLSDKFGCQVDAEEVCLGIHDYLTEDTRVYPNPFNGTQTFKYNLLNDVDEIVFVIIDARGVVVDKLYGGTHQGENIVKWSPNGLKSGLYFVDMYINGVRTSSYKTMFYR